MRKGQGIVVAALLGIGAACGLDTSGQGSGSGALSVGEDPSTEGASDDAATGGEDSPVATSGASSGGGEGPPPDDGSTSGASSDGGMPPDGTTTGEPVDPCAAAPPETFQFDVTMATLEPPMALGTVPGVGTYAYSEAGGGGRATFEFMVSCPGEFRIHAHVHDPETGLDDFGTNPDPDSYFVAFDDQAPTDWWYGCQLYAANPIVGGPSWEWAPVLDNQFCFGEALRRTLQPGKHTVTFVNREAGTHSVSGDDIGDVAAMTHVTVTSDPGFSP